MRPRVGSLFAGVGGFDMGLEAAGFEVAWQVEIDNDAVSVLERHYPDTPRYRDVREVKGAAVAPVDVVCGGFPCQDLSVAGKQAGLAGARSGLFWEVVRIVREMREETEGRYPATVVLENVPGLLNSNGGRDFAAVLRGLGELGAAVAWRVFDAQFFGVPQRRRRVFIVADFAPVDLGERRAAEILSLFESVCRHPAESGASREGSAAVPANGVGSGGVPDVYPTLSAHEGGTLTQIPPIVVPDVAFTLAASSRHTGDGHGNAWNTTYVPAVSGTLTAAMERDIHNGQDDTTPGFLIPVGGQRVRDTLTAHGGSHGRIDAESETFVVANSITASAGHHGHSSPRGDGSDNLIVAAPLTAGGHPNSNAPGRRREDDENLVAISENQRGEIRETPYAYSQTGGGGKPGQGYAAIRQGTMVRRLMPVECERLMGWEDDWTRYRADGTPIADGPRYRMIGNGVAAPVARWIGERLRRALEATPCAS